MSPASEAALQILKIKPKMSMDAGNREKREGQTKMFGASGGRTLAQACEKLFPQVCVCTTREEVTNG